jgi:hypothetical protein
MSLADPLPRATLADILQPESVEFYQSFNQQMSMTGGGETRSSDRAPALWKASVTTIPFAHADALGIQALINSRAGGLKSLLLYDHRLPYPSSDPNGSIIGSTVPELGTITDRLHVAFTGFPADYVMPLGSYFGIVFDTSRYYLGQFVEARTANGSGAIASVEIWPPLPSSISGTPDVIIAKPCAKFRLDAGTARPSTMDALYTTVQFSATQTYSA